MKVKEGGNEAIIRDGVIHMSSTAMPSTSTLFDSGSSIDSSEDCTGKTSASAVTTTAGGKKKAIEVKRKHSACLLSS